jgi:hypothetical protein
MSQALMTRSNLWLVVAVTIVAALLFLSVAYLVAIQLAHVITVMLQAPPQMATQCPGGTMIC